MPKLKSDITITVKLRNSEIDRFMNICDKIVAEKKMGFVQSKDFSNSEKDMINDILHKIKRKGVFNEKDKI